MNIKINGNGHREDSSGLMSHHCTSCRIIVLYIINIAVKRLIAINHIQNKGFCLHLSYAMYTYYVYIKTHTHGCIDFRKKLYLNILYIYL